MGSALTTMLFIFMPPLGSPLPLLGHLTFPLLGVLLERIIYNNYFWLWFMLVAGIAIQIRGIASALMANSDVAGFNQDLYTPMERFISGAAHSGGLLNVPWELGALGTACPCYLARFCSLNFARSG